VHYFVKIKNVLKMNNFNFSENYTDMDFINHLFLKNKFKECEQYNTLTLLKESIDTSIEIILETNNLYKEIYQLHDKNNIKNNKNNIQYQLQLLKKIYDSQVKIINDKYNYLQSLLHNNDYKHHKYNINKMLSNINHFNNLNNLNK